MSDTNQTYNPIATLATTDGFDLLGTVSLVLSYSRHDWAVLGTIVAQHGRTRRGAAVARAYLEGKDA